VRKTTKNIRTAALFVDIQTYLSCMKQDGANHYIAMFVKRLSQRKFSAGG